MSAHSHRRSEPSPSESRFDPQAWRPDEASVWRRVFITGSSGDLGLARPRHSLPRYTDTIGWTAELTRPQVHFERCRGRRWLSLLKTPSTCPTEIELRYPGASDVFEML